MSLERAGGAFRRDERSGSAGEINRGGANERFRGVAAEFAMTLHAPKAAVMTGEASRLCRQHPQTGHPLRPYGIEEHIKRRDLSIANDDHIQARVVGRLVARPRSPSQTTGIVQGLGLAVRGVNEVRVGRAEIASKFVEGFEADEYAGRHIQHTVFGIEVLNRCSAARHITLAEDFLKVAVKQFADLVGDRLSP